MRIAKIGIIGTGWIAGAHIEFYLQMPDVEVVACADLVPGKAEAFKEKYGVEGARCYNSDVELLAAEKDLDGVSICTYNRQHAQPAIDALNAGLHVLLEKPFTVTLDEVRDYVEVPTAKITFGERIVKTFKQSWKNFAEGFQNFTVWFIGAIPTFLVLAVIAGGVAIIIVTTVKRAKKKKNN